MIDDEECNNRLINNLLTSYEKINDESNKLIENDANDLINDLVISCELINNEDDDNDDDIYEGIKYLFDEKIMYYYFKQKDDEIIKHQKVEDIKMPKSSKNESDKRKELGLIMEDLKSIARKTGIKNYENLSSIELVKEIDKLEPSKESKGKKTTSNLLLKGKKRIGFKPKKKSQKKKY